MEIHNFQIAELDVQIIFRDTTVNGMHLLRSFEPFRVDKIAEKPFFRLTVDDSLTPIPRREDNVLGLLTREMATRLLTE